MRGIACGVCALAATAAMAQDAPTKGLSVKLGYLFPGHVSARAEGKQWLVAGLEYQLSERATRNGTRATTVSADYHSKGDFRSVPVLFNVVTRNAEFYWTAGAGVTFAQVPRTSTSGSSTITRTEDSTRFAYSFGVGKEFKQFGSDMFVEARYFGSFEERVNGFAVMVGLRF
ncbi:MAG: hypothetical protein M9921_01400 [Fimbriimonadaceae bacterium]|nr:hypothetical protein [Fimbriimonadaceae bacterium]